MLFNTLSFVVFFCTVLVLYWLLPPKTQKPVLLVASYFFYAYWDSRFLFLIVFVTIVNFYLSKGIFRARDSARKNLLTLTVVFNLLTLGVFKYLNFFASSFNSLEKAIGVKPSFTLSHIILPLGISFFTFKAISYAVDVYKKELEPTSSLVQLGIFLSYFPYMISGPIMSAKVMFPQLRERPARLTSERITSAVLLIALGFFRKTVIGDYAAPLVGRVFGSNTSFDWKTLVIGVFAFSLQIYGDFAGYSDMARGISRLLGIELMRNFQEPYLSKNISEFWRHWHISLSSWFKRYLYIPLGGNRVSYGHTLLNLLLVMTIAGLWHGAAWTFLLWGLVQGILLIGHKLFARGSERANFSGRNPFVTFLSTVFTFLVVSAAWVFFRASSFHVATQMITRVLHKSGGLFDRMDFLQLVILLATSFSLDLVVRTYRKAPLALGTFTSGLVVGILVSTALVFRASEIVPFVYFQF